MALLIHRDDLVELALWLLDRPLEGAFNATSPNPVSMRELATTLGRVLRRPALLPVPALALRIALGEVSDVLLEGQHVLPARALESGFEPAHPDLEPALRHLLARA